MILVYVCLVTSICLIATFAGLIDNIAAAATSLVWESTPQLTLIHACLAVPVSPIVSAAP